MPAPNPSALFLYPSAAPADVRGKAATKRRRGAGKAVGNAAKRVRAAHRKLDNTWEEDGGDRKAAWRRVRTADASYNRARKKYHKVGGTKGKKTTAKRARRMAGGEGGGMYRTGAYAVATQGGIFS